MIWYIATNDKAEKITEEELIKKISNNEINPNTLVVNKQIKHWIAVGQTYLWQYADSNFKQAKVNPVPNTYIYASAVNRQKENRKNIIIIIVTLLVIMAVLVTGLTFIIHKAKNNNEIQSDEITSVETTENTTTSQITQPEDTKVSINNDFFSDLGSTYGELTDKYGEVTYTDYYNGGRYFEFEQGKADYFFKDDNGTAAFFDENLNEYMPNDNSVCFIAMTDTKTLFNNFNDTLTINELEDELGINIEYYYDEDGMDGIYHTSSFVYNNYQISIEMDNNSTISSDDFVMIKELQYYEEANQWIW